MCDQYASIQAPVLRVSDDLAEKPCTRRKKLWELENYYYCSVIGTCLTLPELRQIARKARVSAPTSLSDYELHGIFVNFAREPGPLSRLVQKHLDRKYQRALQQLTRRPSFQDMAAYWQAATATGQVAGAFWALLTHPYTPQELLSQVYGEIHMLSHLAGATIRVDMQELDRLKRRCAQLEQQLAAAQHATRQRLKEQQGIIDRLEQRAAQATHAEHQLVAAQARLAALESNLLVEQLAAEVRALTAQYDTAQERIACAESAAAAWQQQAADSGHRAHELEQQLAEYRKECCMLETTLADRLALASSEDETEAADGVDATPDLIGRCVLYVGGRRSQCAHFRALVEGCNGRFIHHDGGREHARAQLWDVVQQADAILCPLDCVSHDAVHRLKRFCKRNTKPLVLLPRASLAAFAHGLNTVATGES